MSKKERVQRYRSIELLDCILNEIIDEDIGLLGDVDIVRKMYASCHALLNAPEKPWQDYEREMKKFRKHLVKYITHINMAKQKQTTQGETK